MTIMTIMTPMFMTGSNWIDLVFGSKNPPSECSPRDVGRRRVAHTLRPHISTCNVTPSNWEPFRAAQAVMASLVDLYAAPGETLEGRRERRDGRLNMGFKRAKAELNQQKLWNST